MDDGRNGLGAGFSIWDGPVPRFLQPEHRDGDTIEERFLKFHKLNPWIRDTIVSLARGFAAAGHDRVGIKMLFEVLRWQWQLHIVDTGEQYRLNNSFTSRYARLIAIEEPDLADMFEMRHLRAA